MFNYPFRYVLDVLFIILLAGLLWWVLTIPVDGRRCPEPPVVDMSQAVRVSK